ncbi:uncharacterized protein DNG_08762 [Cephalotrichum gorgonifer]|uniref:Glutathionylspermidine synthase pre-ATP-grasp-like domain-containing protein n=1 Tax=Cephalotrichum gorgonifer TaxID=2041049 RepID=A0AAE8SYU6_9PEZI|nr:uncharacterized protein DNG_08762 [Cephalotrichum gorgonifer]
MRRIPVEKRPNATRLVQSQGLVYTTNPDPGDLSDPYWPDDRYYSFTSEEIELLERAGKDVFDMCCEAGDYLVAHPEVITDRMAIPAFALGQIKQSWEQEPAWGSVYGRFDVCFGGLDHPNPRLRVPKFYEFNADTPTSLVEAASIQWSWLEQTGHGNDQLNSITEKLIQAWRRNMTVIEQKLGHRPTIFFAFAKDEPSGEDAMNTTLMMDTATQAGWNTKMLFMEEISLSLADGRFYTKQGEHIDVIFKLYPWEFMVEEGFGEACFKDMERIGERDESGAYIGGTVWIEAPYKMLWSNKSLFAILWELFKDDPRSKWLLPTYFENDAPASLTSYARKPIFAREGADIVLREDGQVIQDATTGYYGKEGYILQELALPPEFRDASDIPYYPVLGLWFVDGDVAGMGIREDKTPITTNGSTFIPHSISDGSVNYDREPVPDLAEIEASLNWEQYVEAEDGSNRELLEYIERVVR